MPLRAPESRTSRSRDWKSGRDTVSCAPLTCGTFEGISSDGGGAHATASSSELSGRSALCAPTMPARPIITRATTNVKRTPRMWLLSRCLGLHDGLQFSNALVRLYQVL